MVMAAELSARLGLVPPAFVAAPARASSPPPACRCAARRWALARYLELMRVDKKAEGGEIRFVVIEAPGRAAVRAAPDAVVARVHRSSTATPA